MIYVINLVDGGGQEFFLTAEGRLINLSSQGQEPPQEFKSMKQLTKKLDQLRPNYSPVCQLYALEKSEFIQRHKMLQEVKIKPESRDDLETV